MEQSVKLSDIHFKEVIGKGLNSTVTKAEWDNWECDKIIAVKKYYGIGTFSEKDLIKGYSGLLCIKNENILQFYGASESTGFFSNWTFLLMEYADCGSLYEQIHGSTIPSYYTSTALNWMHQCAKGLAFLHGMKPLPIVHHNLKPHNLFLTNNFRQLKIGELAIEPEWDVDMLRARESMAYIAPEGLHNQLCKEKYDVYSYGIVLWEVLSRRRPLYKLRQSHILAIIVNIFVGYYPPLTDVPEKILSGKSIRSLIADCWDHEPEKRPSMELVATIINSYKSLYIDENISIKLTDVKLGEIVGSGAFGAVFKAQILDVQYAVKKYFVEDNKKGIEKEVKYLSQASHKNIVKLFGTVEDTDSKTMIVMEFADCGTLFKYLHQGGEQKRYYTYLAALNWMHQLALGLEYLHAMKPRPIIHRDIKTKNLLLFNKFKTLKIADFGTVTEQATLMTKNVGTTEYMAPEVPEGGMYTEKSDVYSFGIVFWEVMSQKKPFYHLGNKEPLTIINVVSQGARPPIDDVKNYPNCENIKSMIELCWDIEPQKRPFMKDLVFFLSIDFNNSDFNGCNIKQLPETSNIDYLICDEFPEN